MVCRQILLILAVFRHILTYFHGSVLECVPKRAEWVLLVGCADGVTEAKLVEKGVKIIGVEINHGLNSRLGGEGNNHS